MNYFNFFSQSDQSSFGKKKAEMKGVTILVVVAIALMVLVELGLFYVDKSYQSQLQFVKDIYANPVFISQCSTANQVKSEIDEANENLVFLSDLGLVADNISVTNRYIYERINHYFNNQSYIDTIDISGQYIVITGNTNDLEKITEITQRFRDDKEFKNVLLTIVSRSNSTGSKAYLFSMTMYVNGYALAEMETEGEN